MGRSYPLPIPGFLFEVEVDGAKMSFKEVSGLEVSLKYDTIKEGGRLDYVHRVPTVTEYSTLSLKRGVLPASTDFLDWVMDTMFVPRSPGGLIKKDITVTLLNPSKGHETVNQWTFYGCYPVKWSVGQLNSMENSVAIESIDFAYTEFYAT